MGCADFGSGKDLRKDPEVGQSARAPHQQNREKEGEKNMTMKTTRKGEEEEEDEEQGGRGGDEERKRGGQRGGR